jgi:hypothetical protein
MSGAPNLDMIRAEVADLLARVSAHAAAGSVHANAGTDRLLVAELRCCAATLLSASTLVSHLRPGEQKSGRRAA